MNSGSACRWPGRGRLGGVSGWVWVAVCLLGWGVSLPVRATPQTPCQITIEGETLGVYGIRLNAALSNRLEEIQRKRDYAVISTANYKGFGTVLRLRGKMLFLEHLWMEDRTEYESSGRAEVPLEGCGVPGEKPPLFAGWFTGHLRHYVGKRLGPNTHLTERVRIYSFRKGLLERVWEEDASWATSLED